MFNRWIVVHNVVSEQGIVKGHLLLLWHIFRETPLLFNDHRPMYVATRLLIKVLLQVNWGIVLLGSFIADTSFSLFAPDEIIFLHDTPGNSRWYPRILGVPLIFDHLCRGVLTLPQILLGFIHTFYEILCAMTYSAGCDRSVISHQIELLLVVRKFRAKSRKTLLPAEFTLWTS